MSILDFAEHVWFHIMECCIPTTTTDNNTITGMIWLTLNVGRSAAKRRGNVMELSETLFVGVYLYSWGYDNMSAEYCIRTV